MRGFYIEYSQNANLQLTVADLRKSILPPLVAELSWTKNVDIMQKLKDPLEREFYIKMTKLYGWAKDLLINNIENQRSQNTLQTKPILTKSQLKSIGFKRSLPSRTITILIFSKWALSIVRRCLRRV
jgi:hypothetical protein